MTNIVQSDIFFFVTTIAIVLFSVLGVILFAYAVKILSNLRHISERVRKEGDFLLDEMGKLRERIKINRFSFRFLFRLIRRVVGRYM